MCASRLGAITAKGIPEQIVNDVKLKYADKTSFIVENDVT